MLIEVDGVSEALGIEAQKLNVDVGLINVSGVSNVTLPATQGVSLLNENVRRRITDELDWS